MKKSMFVLTAALSFGVAMAQTAPVAPATPTTAPAAAPQVPALTDVPAGHWAKDAIDRLVSQGIILGYPDGTYRGTQNLTRYEAAVIIARLLDQVRQGQVNPGAIDAETLTALQNAIQELAADLTALGVRVSDLEENAVNRDDFTRLEARVEELAAASGDAAAIAAIQTQIAELTARADEYDTLRADIDDNASSIAALNDLTVLLNQDILNLQDRVSAVESAQADFVQRSDFDNLAGRVNTIDTRVTTLENAPKFSVGGTIGANYGRLALTSPTTGGQNFDVDRLTDGTFAAGVFSNPDYGADVSVEDTNSNFTTGSLTFGVRASNLRTTNGQIVVNNAALNFGVGSATGGNNFRNVNGGPGLVNLRNATADGTINGQKFDVTYQSYDSLFKFSDYLFNNSAATSNKRRGVVINLEATQLPLQPKLTVVTGNANGAGVTGIAGNAGGTTATGATANYFGIRAAVKPAGLGDVGVSFAQVNGNRSAFGVDYNVNVGIVNVKGEGVASIPSTAGNFLTGGGNFQNVYQTADGAFYTNVTGDLGVVKFGANFRSINPLFDVLDGDDNIIPNAGMSTVSSLPYEAGYTGFGAAFGTNLGPIALGVYGDTYVPFATTTPRTTAFGAKAGGKLGALELVGFANRTTVNNNPVRSADDRGNAGMGIANVPYDYTSTVGAQLKHDGAATNALVKNLNFTISNAYYYVEPLNEFTAYADYSATVAGVTLQPLVRYNLRSDRDTADRAGTDETTNTFKYGIKASTATLTGVPLQPNLYFNFANRITNPGTALTVGNGTTTELLGQVGVGFNQFLVPTGTAKIGYSYYQGFGVEQVGASVGAENQAFNAADNRIYSGVGNQSGKVDGVYAQVGFSGLSANYGIFRYNNLTPGANAATNVAQGFRVNYTFNF
nr:S-layer homology domain-containing protein [Deinococcus budaensis]